MLHVEQLADAMPGVTDGMATVVKVDCFNLSSGMLNRISSHVCANVLIEGWILTLMYIDSFIVLVQF